MFAFGLVNAGVDLTSFGPYTMVVFLSLVLGKTFGTRREPFNSTPVAVNSVSFGSPHVRPMGRTCGEPDEIKKNTHPKDTTALFRVQASGSARRGCITLVTSCPRGWTSSTCSW